jgi:hypothetical protein
MGKLDAAIEYRGGHAAEALAAVERAMALNNGGDASTWFTLAMAHAQRGDKDRARRWFDNAVAWTRANDPRNWAKNNEGTYGQFHVRVDFIDAAVGGWVPVDPTFSLIAARDGKDPDINFGANNGDFITMHLNSEVSPEGSNFEMPLHQFDVLAFRGNGPFRPKITETWTVSGAR